VKKQVKFFYNQDIFFYDQNFANIKLVPFSVMQNDKNLRSKYLNWLNDLEVVKLIASPSLLEPKGPSFIEASFDRFTRPDSLGFFVWYEPDKVFIGTTKLDKICINTSSAWDGIMIGDKNYQGRGLSIVIYRTLLAFAFTELGLNRVSSGCNENNIQMIKTFYRAGYKLEGRFRQADLIDDEFSDHLYFGILYKDFTSANCVKIKLERCDKNFVFNF
jgi:RimJ/RimL family protein N-acetyltransferase